MGTKVEVPIDSLKRLLGLVIRTHGITLTDQELNDIYILGGAITNTPTRSNEVQLLSFGTRKIAAIKSVRSHTGLGLKEAKEAVEGLVKLTFNSTKDATAFIEDYNQHTLPYLGARMA